MLIKKFWNKIIQATWNIAIAEMREDLTPVNIKWVKHNYSDRWFADPFFLDVTPDYYVVLAEELMLSNNKGRICKLFIEKKECELIHNETLLDIETHLSFPNYFTNKEKETFIYPENNASGHLTIYRLSEQGPVPSTIIPIPLIDPVLLKRDDGVLLLGTLPEDANDNILHIYKSSRQMDEFEEIQRITFSDNIARRAGNVFEWNGKIIAPGQICNKHYGEGISLQEVTSANDGSLVIHEIKRLEAKKVTKMTGFHTYNVMGKAIVMDGYHYGNEFIHDLYFKLRGLKNM